MATLRQTGPTIYRVSYTSFSVNYKWAPVYWYMVLNLQSFIPAVIFDLVHEWPERLDYSHSSRNRPFIMLVSISNTVVRYVCKRARFNWETPRKWLRVRVKASRLCVGRQAWGDEKSGAEVRRQPRRRYLAGYATQPPQRRILKTYMSNNCIRVVSYSVLTAFLTGCSSHGLASYFVNSCFIL